MTAIFAVEIQRALARRLVRMLLLFALLGIVLAVVIAFANAESDGVDAFSPDDIWSTDPDADSIVGGTSLLFLFVALIAGASFVGAEYKAGTFTTLLTWEPRRFRVLAAKLAAAAVVAAALFVVLEILLAVALVPVVVVQGSGFENVADDFYRSLAGFLGRGALVIGGCAVLGASIATIGRNTTAALGMVLGYLVVVESILRGLRPGWDAWFFLENIVITLNAEHIDGVTRSVPGAALVLLAYLAVVVAGAVVVFARRDVT